MRPYKGEAFLPGADESTNEALAQRIKSTAESVYRPVGTCKMGADDLSVVDAQLHVHGAQNLRVIDASIMPNIISATPTSAP